MRIDVRQNDVIHACRPSRMASQIAIFVPIPRRLIADVLINMLQVRPAREHFYLTYRFLIGKGWHDSTLTGERVGLVTPNFSSRDTIALKGYRAPRLPWNFVINIVLQLITFCN